MTADVKVSCLYSYKELPTLKDNDFIKHHVRIDIGEAAKEKLLETLTADVEFKELPTLKDNDFIKHHVRIDIGEAAKEKLLETLWGFNTPPDSPRGVGAGLAGLGRAHYEGIIPELDIYAIPSQENAAKKEIYFVALIDVLTHYGVKKQAAKAAKTVKYGSNVDGISTCDPEQYGKRFIEFVAKAIDGNYY
ncbi:phosphatidylinositol-4-phosphate 5-Kinase domain-containing protein [Phthorimaea operculella]|nr:phosphatidylinositol-4-phosphate 5-Kinase domain-containing protein [Phthorimaea operculella]